MQRIDYFYLHAYLKLRQRPIHGQFTRASDYDFAVWFLHTERIVLNRFFCILILALAKAAPLVPFPNKALSPVCFETIFRNRAKLRTLLT